jgi:hypothetical protein
MAGIENGSELDMMGETRGWTKVDASSSRAPMASQVKTQLFRREIDMSQQVSAVFQDPRIHTGMG